LLLFLDAFFFFALSLVLEDECDAAALHRDLSFLLICATIEISHLPCQCSTDDTVTRQEVVTERRLTMIDMGKDTNVTDVSWTRLEFGEGRGIGEEHDDENR